MPGAIQVLGKLLNWSIKEGPPPREYADQSECRMAERGAGGVASGGFPAATAWGAWERGSFVVASASFVASRLGVASCCFCRVGRGCQCSRAGEWPLQGCFGERSLHLRFSKELEGSEEPEGGVERPGSGVGDSLLEVLSQPRDLKEPFVSPDGVHAPHIR